MAFEFSLQTAIVGTLGSSLVLAATLHYLWRLEPSMRALLYWSLAFAAQTLRLGAQLGTTLGIGQFWFATDILFAAVTVFIWLGARYIADRPARIRLVSGALLAALIWNLVAVSLELPFAARTFPLYAIAAGAMIVAGTTLRHLARKRPGIGYGVLALLFTLLGLHYLDYPFLRNVAWFAPIGFAIAATLMLGMGLAMLIITQRRQQFAFNDAAEELAREAASRKESEYSHRTLVDALDEGIFVVDRSGKVRNANPAAAAILNIPLDKLRGSSINIHHFALFSDNGDPLPLADYPMRRALVDGEGTSGMPVRVIRPDGASIWLSVNAHPLFQAGDPQPYAAVIAFNNVSAQRAAERQLLASELRFRSIFEAVSNIAVQGYDSWRRVIYWNSASTAFYGYSAEEAYGRTVDSLIMREEDVEDFAETYERLLASGRPPRPAEHLLRRKDGSLIEVYSSLVMITNLAGEPEVYCIDLDLSTIRQLEQELEESSERFRAITESSELGVVVADSNGSFVYCNARYLELVDASMDEVRSGAWIDHVHPDDREPIRRRWQEAVAARSGFSMERRVINRDGSIQWGHAHITPIVTHGGLFKGFVATVEDITPLKETEQALRMSEARFAGAFHASLDYITISDIATGRLLDVNEAFERITGWHRDEAIGKTTTDLGIWRDRETRDKAMQQIWQDGHLRDYPMQLGLRDGSTRDCLLNASLIAVDGSQLLLGVVRDVTTAKRAEEALRQNEEKFSRMVHYSPTALVITDVATGVIVDFNAAWQEIFGFSRDQTIGRTSLDFGMWVTAEDRNALYAALAANGGQLDRYECRYRRADGSVIYCLASGRQIEIGGRLCFLWSITDITLRHDLSERMAQLNSELELRVEERSRELQRAQDELLRSEKLAALGALVAGVAHELNTPIGNAVTVASTLHEKTSEFTEQLAAGALKRSVLNAFIESSRTASDLLLKSLAQARNLVASFKQVAVDQTSDQRRRFDLHEVVGEVMTTLSPTLRKQPFEVIVDIPEGIVMDSFPGPLGQIVANCVNNAVLHAFEGRRSGTIQVRAAQDGEDDVELTVSDDGIGIPEENVRRIFDPFFTTKLGQGGSGLGLNIVYNIATQILGGRISVESRVGAGTTFALRMPLCAPRSPGKQNHNDDSYSA